MTDTSDTELFDSSVQDQDDSPIEEDKNYLEELVGEGKKFKTVEDLARGKIESDKFILQLQKENQGLRKEFDTRLSLEEFMERQNQLSKNPPAKPEPEPDGNQSTKVSPEDLKTLVRETLEQETLKERQVRNLNSVKQKLTEQWGPNFAKVLEQKATDLEVGKDFLNSLAATNPTAFFRLVGMEDVKPTQNYVPPPTSTTDVKRTSGAAKTFKDFQKLLRENPREYYSPRVQNEMFRLAKEHGEAFYR